MKKFLEFIFVFSLLFSPLSSQVEISANVNSIKNSVKKEIQSSNSCDIIFCTYDEFEDFASLGIANEIYAHLTVYSDLPIAFDYCGKKMNGNVSVYQTVRRKLARPEKKRFALLKINGCLTALISFSISNSDSGGYSYNVAVDVLDRNADTEQIKGITYGFFNAWIRKQFFLDYQPMSICVAMSEEFDLLKRYENEFLDDKENVEDCCFIEGSEMSVESLLYEVDKKRFFKNMEPSLEYSDSTNDSCNKKSMNIYKKKVVKKNNKANNAVYRKKVIKDKFNKKTRSKHQNFYL